MALWRKNSALTEAEKHRRRREHEKKIIRSTYTEDKQTQEIIRRCSFYHYDSNDVFRENESIESASNRRAAGKYVPNN